MENQWRWRRPNYEKTDEKTLEVQADAMGGIIFD